MTILQRRLDAAFFLAGNAGFFEIELAFDAPARFVGDLAFLQQPVDVFALGRDQFHPQLRGHRRGIVAVRLVFRQSPGAIIVTGAQDRQRLG